MMQLLVLMYQFLKIFRQFFFCPPPPRFKSWFCLWDWGMCKINLGTKMRLDPKCKDQKFIFAIPKLFQLDSHDFWFIYSTLLLKTVVLIFATHFLQARFNQAWLHCELNSCIILYFILLSIVQAHMTYRGN